MPEDGRGGVHIDLSPEVAMQKLLFVFWLFALVICGVAVVSAHPAWAVDVKERVVFACRQAT